MNNQNLENEKPSAEEAFLASALRRSELLRQNDVKAANREYDLVHKAFKRLRERPDRGEAALKRIALVEDFDVQNLAAAALLAIDEDFAISLLEKVQRNSSGLPGLAAEMTIREWKRGTLRDYWG